MAMQLNSKSFKDGRNILGEYKVARYKIADKCNEYGDAIKKLKQTIKENAEKIEKIKNGTLVTSRTIESFEEENKAKASEISDYEKMIDAVKDEQEDAIARAENLVTKDFQKSALVYTSNIHSESARNDLLTHVVKFFTDLGIENVETSDVESYINGLGVQNNSNRKMSEDYRMTKGNNNVTKLFLGIVVDEPKMAKALESYTYKFEFQFEKKMKKAKKSDN